MIFGEFLFERIDFRLIDRAYQKCARFVHQKTRKHLRVNPLGNYLFKQIDNAHRLPFQGRIQKLVYRFKFRQTKKLLGRIFACAIRIRIHKLAEHTFGISKRAVGKKCDYRNTIFIERVFFTFQNCFDALADLCVRERIVSGTFSSSVVAKINIACSGGSSSVFKSALNASLVSMCTSSIIYTLRFACMGVKRTASLSSRISSIPRFDAASISMRSSALPALNSRHIWHELHGSLSSPRFSQLYAFAKSRASVVLPVPRVPENKYACETRPRRKAFFSTVTTCSCPTTSAKLLGRYLR